MTPRVCRSRNSDRRPKMWKNRTGCSEVVQQLFRVNGWHNIVIETEYDDA